MMADPRRVVIIDNFDSYTHNLCDLVFEVTGSRPVVVRNDESKTFRQMEAGGGISCVILSPGPGRPHREADFGICRAIIDEARHPVFGVCLGFQGLALAHGMQVGHSPSGPVHGQIYPVTHTGAHRMFEGIPQGFNVTRYHSLAIVNQDGTPCDFPADVEKLAWTDDGIVMALAHRSLPHWGVQFHPESVCTQHGATLLRNFFAMAAERAPRPAHNAPPAGIMCEEEEQGQGAHPSSGWHVRPGMQGLRVLSRVVQSWADPQVVYREFFRGDDDSYWLDTARQQSETGRFSFMGGSDGPLSYRLSYRVGSSEVVELPGGAPPDAVKVHRGTRLLPFVEARLADAATAPPQGSLPFEFCGGFVGYLGYEMKEECFDMRGEKNAHVSGEPDAKLLFSDRFMAWDHLEGRSYIVALCNVGSHDEQMAWIDSTETRLTALASSPSPSSSSSSPSSLFSPNAAGTTWGTSWGIDEPQGEMKGPGSIAFAPLPPSAPPPDPAPGRGPAGHMMGVSGGGEDDVSVSFRPGKTQGQYEEAVRACQRQIVDGESYELCLTGKLTAPVTPDVFELYSILRKRNKAPYAALLRLGPSSALCCSSPERFLSVTSRGCVESRPIKGTRPRGGTEEEDDTIRSELRGCTKDVAENLMVVDLVRSDLSRVCKPGSVHVPKLFSIETYATVHQMVTVVRGQLEDGIGAIGAVEHTFPMGSMTGAPKSRTMSLLEEIETGARGPYSGTMGYFSVNGAADLAVVIRTAHVTPRGVTVGAGGAITILSDPSEEWREMLLKARAVVDSTLEACRMAPSHMAKEGPQGARFGPSSDMS